MIMNNQKEILEVRAYEAPQIEIIEVAVEKGFAASDPYGETDPWN